MKSISTQLIITGIRSRVDGSIGLSASTPELKPEQKTLFFELQNHLLDVKITPIEEPNVPIVKIDKELNIKTHSQRLRGSLYRVWERGDSGYKIFDDFYNIEMERIIHEVQNRIDL